MTEIFDTVLAIAIGIPLAIFLSLISVGGAAVGAAGNRTIPGRPAGVLDASGRTQAGAYTTTQAAAEVPLTERPRDGAFFDYSVG